MVTSVQQLLKHRYLVLANYPNSPYQIGDVFEIDDAGQFALYQLETLGQSDREFKMRTIMADEKEIPGYPALFSPVPWFYGRKDEELPLFVQYTGHDQAKQGQVEKVADWEICGVTRIFFKIKAEQLYLRYAGDYTPISRIEYNYTFHKQSG